MPRQNRCLTINYSYFPNSHSQRPLLNPPPSICCLIVSKHPFKSNHLRVVYKADSCAHFTCKSRTFQRKTRMGKKRGVTEGQWYSSQPVLDGSSPSYVTLAKHWRISTLFALWKRSARDPNEDIWAKTGLNDAVGLFWEVLRDYLPCSRVYKINLGMFASTPLRGDCESLGLLAMTGNWTIILHVNTTII